MRVDAIDCRILVALQQNGRLSNQDLADKVALSPSACLRRVRNLEEQGIISGYHASLDAHRLGYELEAIVHVNLDRTANDWHEQFLQQLEQLDEIVAAYIVAGPCNYILHIRCKNLAAFSSFIVEKLNPIPAMRDMCSYIVIRKVKDKLGQLALG